MKWCEDVAGRVQVHKHQVCDRLWRPIRHGTHRGWRSNATDHFHGGAFGPISMLVPLA